MAALAERDAPAAARAQSVDEAPWPHNLEAEAAVLAAVILEPTAYDDIHDLLTPERFYSESHRWVYASFVALREAGRGIDTVTVMNWLKEHGRIEQVGVAYFTEMLGATPAIANAREHAQIVHDKWRLREFLRKVAMYRAEAMIGRRDTQEILSDVAQDLGNLASANAPGRFVSIGEVVRSEISRISDANAAGKSVVGLRTGIDRFDRVTGGLRNKEFTIVAARPGVGKTALALNISVCVAANDPTHGVAIFSLEMPKEQLAVRMLSSEARVNTLNVLQGQLTALHWSKLTDAAKTLYELGIAIDDTPAIPVPQMRAKLRQLRNEYEAKGRRLVLCVVDYLQLMGTNRSSNSTREQELSEVSRSMKTLAKEFDIPLIALSQLNRAVETRAVKRPQLSDLRESGGQEQDADNVVFIYRDAYYKKKGVVDPNVAELIIAKQRNGPTTTVKAHWEGYCAAFSNIADGEFVDDDPDERTGAR